MSSSIRLIQESFATRRALIRHSLAAAGLLSLGTAGSAVAQATPESGAPAPEGGRLRVAYEGAGTSESLAPMAYTAIDFMRQTHVHEPLARFVDSGQQMDLATEIVPNEDGSVWTVSLRPDVTWHDGSPFTAADVLYTIAFHQDMANGGFYLPLVANIDLASARAVDDLTLELPLLQPANDLHLLIGGGEILILKEGFTDLTTMVGTGPFQLVEFVPGAHSLLARNPAYWGYPERGPYLDELELISLVGATARVNAVEADQADLAPSISFADGARLLESDSVTVIQSEPPSVSSNAFIMRLNDGPFADIRLRHAVKLGTDRQALVDAALLGFGLIGNDLYGIGLEDYNDAIPQRPYDPEEARRLVQEAGADGLTFALQVSQGAVGIVEAATLLVDQLAEIGLHGEIETLQQESFSIGLIEGTLTAPMVMGQGGGFLMTTTWQFNYAPGAPTNLSGWNDEGWFANFSESQQTPDPAHRTELLNAMQEQLWEEGGDLVWGFSRSLMAAKPNVANVTSSYYPILTGAYFADSTN